MLALTVDDSRAMRLILCRMLAECQIDTLQASDAYVALEILEEQRPDLILVDWHMPKMDGVEFIKLIRQKPYFYSGFIMMVTTENNADQIINALNSGADEYLMKPFTKELLEGKLALLGMSR